MPLIYWRAADVKCSNIQKSNVADIDTYPPRVRTHPPFKTFLALSRNEKRIRHENIHLYSQQVDIWPSHSFLRGFKFRLCCTEAAPIAAPAWAGNLNEGGDGMEMLFFLLAGCILGLLSGWMRPPISRSLELAESRDLEIEWFFLK